jgi:short chain dehydrogenase
MKVILPSGGPMKTIELFKKMNGVRRRDVEWRRQPLGNLSGKRMAIIGGTNGLGRALARTFATHGAEVIVVGRTFRDEGVKRLSFIPADLSEMKQAKRVAEELPAETLDLLLFSNGIGPVGKRLESSEGIERDVAVSCLSRFVITRGVADRLGTQRPAKSLKPRIFLLGGPGVGITGDANDLNAEQTKDYWAAHMNTVAGNEAIGRRVAVSRNQFLRAESGHGQNGHSLAFSRERVAQTQACRKLGRVAVGRARRVCKKNRPSTRVP